MNIFNQLFNPKIKIMDKIAILISLHAFYGGFDTPKDKARVIEFKAAIDAEALKLVPTTFKADVKPAEVVKPGKPVVILKAKPVEAAAAAAQVEELAAEEVAAEEVPEDEDDEKVYDVYPFYPCQIKTENGKFFDVPKPPKAFTIAENEETQLKVNNAYPTVDEFDMIMDEAWKLACTGTSAKDLNVMLKKNLGGWYAKELKGESDYYSKLSNPICSAVAMIKKAFGKHPKDVNVLITRPDGYQAGKPGVPVIISAKTDMTVLAKAVEEKPAVAEKPALKTIQNAKPADKAKPAAEKAKDPIDEEAQEASAAETVEEVVEEAAAAEEVAEVAATDDANAPAVNIFAKFNSIENSVAEKFIEGEKLATAAKADDEKKTIKNNKREESRSLIQSWFDGKDWVENTEDGKWNPKLIAYHNNLLREIQSNRANWPK